MDIANYIGAGLSVGLAGVGVAIGQGFLGKAAVEVMGKRKELGGFFLTITILGMALVESAVIYGFIVAFSILGNADMTIYAAIGGGLAIGLAGLGAGVGEGLLVAGAIKAIDETPEIRGKIMTFMVLFIALIESSAIYGLVVSFQIIGNIDPNTTAYIGKGLAVGLAGMGVAIGHGLLANKTIISMAKRSELSGFLLTLSILGIALVESAAIYGLVVATIMIGNEVPLYAAIGAGLAIGLTGMGAGIGEGKVIGGAMNAATRNPSIKGKIITFMVLFVALAEVTAIYGLIIVTQILGTDSSINTLLSVGAGSAVGFSGLGVAIGIGILADKSIQLMGKNPKMSKHFLTVTILGIALLESAVIYGFVVAFQVIGLEASKGLIALGAGLAVGIAGLGVGIGEGLIIRGAMEGMNKSPDEKGRLLAFMVLFVALVEVVAIYALIIAFRAIV